MKEAEFFSMLYRKFCLGAELLKKKTKNMVKLWAKDLKLDIDNKLGTIILI